MEQTNQLSISCHRADVCDFVFLFRFVFLHAYFNFNFNFCLASILFWPNAKNNEPQRTMKEKIFKLNGKTATEEKL